MYRVTIHGIHAFTVIFIQIVLIYCCAGGLGTSYFQIAQGGDKCAVIRVAAITHHMQPTACQCFSAQSHKNPETNQHELKTSTRVNSRSSGCNSADVHLSFDKEEDCQFCIMHYFDHCSEHFDYDVLLLLLLWTISHAG